MEVSDFQMLFFLLFFPFPRVKLTLEYILHQSFQTKETKASLY